MPGGNSPKRLKAAVMNQSSSLSSVTRRRFTGMLSGVMAGAWTGYSGAAAVAPSERITLGQIGLGSRGFNLLDAFLKHSDCQFVAVCDVDRYHHRDRAWGRGPAYGREPARDRITQQYAAEKSGTLQKGLAVYSDYRELIARDDIDAIIVATPDHWHALCTYEAIQAGKDVYCEKPVTHLFAEGRTIVSEVERQDAVFQTGSQQRSDPLFEKLVEITQSGRLGTVRAIEVGLPPGYSKPQGSTTIVKPRDDHDYDMWCGPAQKLPLMQARHHRWWRGHRTFGGGVLMDWIGHHNDIAQWAIGTERFGPTLVEAVDWQYPETDVYNTPEHYTIRCEYPGGVTSTISDANRIGLKIIGDDGWVYATRGRLDASDTNWLDGNYRISGKGLAPTARHVANFLECVKSRNECAAPATIAHRSITPGHLGYVSQAVGRPLRWDPKSERVQNDEEANVLLNRVQYRTPWIVPG